MEASSLQSLRSLSPHDLTDHAITMRRTACIQHLTQLVTKTNTLPALWQATLAGLGGNQKDVPFALLYSVARPQKSVASSHSVTDDVLCTLEGMIGVDRGHAVARESLALGPHADGFARSVFEAVATGETVMLDASHPDLAKLMNGIEWKGYGAPSHHFAVVRRIEQEEILTADITTLSPADQPAEGCSPSDPTDRPTAISHPIFTPVDAYATR